MIKSLVTEKDFTATLTYAYPKVTEVPSIATDSWAWSENMKSAHINDASITKLGGFRLYLGYLKRGDTVNLRCECMGVSGATVNMILDSSPTSILGQTGGGIYEFTTKSIVSDHTFDEINVTYTIPADVYCSVYVGTLTAEIGEYYIRNLVADVNTICIPEPKHFKTGFRQYTMSGVSGIYSVIAGYSLDTATLVVDSVGKKITLTHAKPFDSGTGVPYQQQCSSGESYKYIVRVRSQGSATVIIEIFDMATNTLQDPAVVATANGMWISILFIGLDFVVDVV